MNRMAVSRFTHGPIVLVCAIVFSSFTSPCLAQQPLQVLQNHVPTAVSSGQAALVNSLPLTQKLHITITLPLRNQDALTSLLQRLYDPNSPDFRQFLTVAQFTEQFAPTESDYSAVVNFVTSFGLTVTDQPTDRLIIPIDGTVQQIQSAFNLRMNVYQHPTENRTFYAPDREPSLNLQLPIAHITGLDNFVIPHPALVTRSAGSQKSPVPAAGSGPGGSYLASDMRAAYYGGSALNGSGQTVGLVEFDGYNLSDVNLTFSSVGQSYNVPIHNVLLDGATGAACQFISPCSDAEEVLDIVQAIGMAPSLSQVRVYIGTTDVDIFHSIYNENIAKEISISWVWGANTSGDDPIFTAMAAVGQTIFSASGDWGSYPAIYPAFPAEDVNVTGVGGTDLTTSGPGGTWVSETGWSDSGGGPSPDGISIPSWQSGLTGVNGSSTTLRNAPDVGAEANFDNYYCNLGACGGGAAGTSFATPRWAGYMALVNQQAVNSGRAPHGGLGFINPTLYSIGEGSNYHNDFHDITSGSNGRYSAGSGFDLVTGWGSPNGQNLINDLVGSGQLQAATPYESNVTVNLHGMPPTSIDYLITFQDATPGATIHYQVTICNSPYAWATTSPGSQVDFYNPCPSITPYGTMYATAPNYLQSSSTSMSF